jgi:hypothetical protein
MPTIDLLLAEAESLADAAIAAAGLNDADGWGASSKRRFGRGARSTHAALTAGAKVVAMKKAPTVVVTIR